MIFDNNKKKLSEDVPCQRVELSLDDLDEVTGGNMSFEEYQNQLNALNQQNWNSRDEYVDAVNALIKKYNGLL